MFESKGLAFFALAVLALLLVNSCAAPIEGDDNVSNREAKRLYLILRRNNRQSGQSVTDNCKLYGHSCLGGHGKRSGGPDDSLFVPPGDFQFIHSRADDSERPLVDRSFQQWLRGY